MFPLSRHRGEKKKKRSGEIPQIRTNVNSFLIDRSVFISLINYRLYVSPTVLRHALDKKRYTRLER